MTIGPHRQPGALADALEHLPQVPNWLLIVDDDTFVNVPALRRRLSQLQANSSRSLYAGQTGLSGLRQTPFIYGGAGHLMSAGVLNVLRRRQDGIEKCLSVAAARCDQLHSDWTLAHCLLVIVRSVPRLTDTRTLQEVPHLTDWGDVMRQNKSACAAEARLQPGEERRRCKAMPNITCHGMRSASNFRALSRKWC